MREQEVKLTVTPQQMVAFARFSVPAIIKEAARMLWMHCVNGLDKYNHEVFTVDQNLCVYPTNHQIVPDISVELGSFLGVLGEEECRQFWYDLLPVVFAGIGGALPGGQLFKVHDCYYRMYSEYVCVNGEKLRVWFVPDQPVVSQMDAEKCIVKTGDKITVEDRTLLVV